MENSLISRIQKFTLDARHALENEASEQLEGIYGWKPDGEFSSASGYPAVSTIDEAKKTREALERYADEENEIGVPAKDAREKLVRETAFTWLNRFVALKMMEERHLLKTTISRLHESAAYSFWLADEVDPEAEALDKAGELPVNAMGEGPRNIAYRRFILWQCRNLARDVSVLFDPDDLPSRLFPRSAVFKNLMDSMNSEGLVEVWKVGNEETVGWVYQGFNVEEKEFVKAGFKKGIKITAEGIGPFTGTYTPSWIVKKLVENSVGAFWLEMHPDSRLIEKMNYWVPQTSIVNRKSRLAKDISFLDPACGSMHFGLVAFDIFFEIYLEEMQKAGQPGWPGKSSVSDVSEIPGMIIEKNIFGMDLDLRAVQLAALTLFLKARSKNPSCPFTDKNIICTNVEKVVGGKLEEFINNTQFSHPIYERIIRALAAKLKDSDNLGSLLRLEEDLLQLIRHEKRKARTAGQKDLELPGFFDEMFENRESLDSFFESLEREIQSLLDGFVRRSQIAGNGSNHFAAEASKGLRLLKVMRCRYDIVATNPPYLDSRDYNSVHKSFLEKEYSNAKRNLFTAFIQRCLGLAKNDGFVAMITGQSFMFISTFENFRRQLREIAYIRFLAQHDYHLFAERIDTVAFVLRKEPDEEARRKNEGVFFRLVKQKNADAKRLAFEEALAAYRSGGSHPLVFKAGQTDFDRIPDKPWVYWMPERLARLFLNLELIETFAKPRQGLATADNDRFLRHWWEVGKSRIGLGKASCKESHESEEKWFPYMKGGTPISWWGNQENVVDWRKDGAAIRCFGQEEGKIRSRPQNTDFYFRRGVTWSDVSSKGFAARLSPGGFIHDVTGMTCFPAEENIKILLGLLNSRVTNYLLSALNPTIHFQVGDIERLPVPDKRSPIIDALVMECVELARQDSRESEKTWEFVQPLESLKDFNNRKDLLSRKETLIDAEVSRLYGLTEEDLAAIDFELSSNGSTMDEDTVEDGGESDEMGFSDMTEEEWARQWISYAAGIAFGRFQIGVDGGLGSGRFEPEIISKLGKFSSSDGILVSDLGQPLDLAKRVLSVLEAIFGATETNKRIKTALGEGNVISLLENWFGRFSGTPASSFWKYHFQMYRKRPVYWPLQSPKKLFTVWIFHERLTSDTLFFVRNSIVEPRIRLAEGQIKDLTPKAEKDKSVRQALDRIRDILDDLKKFSESIRKVTENGYSPCIDDGVLVNASPLNLLLPSWSDTAKAWKELEKGEFDWAHQAMNFFPERVENKCRSNRSLAITHGLERLCPPDENGKVSSGGRRRGRKPGEA